MAKGSADDRRRAARRQARFKVHYWSTAVDRVGRSTNISGTGLFIETRHAVPVGTRLHLEVYLPTGSFFAEGIVIRTLPNDAVVLPGVLTGLAVRFVTLAEAIRAADTA